MKLKYFILTFLLTFILTVKPIKAQYDINVKISETEINNALTALIEARGLNWGKYIGHFIDAWYVNVDAVTVDILPNNQVIVSANVAAVMDIDLWLFTVPSVAHPSGLFIGNFEVIGDPNGGFQLKFVPDYDTFSLLGQIIFSLLPPIEINLGTFVLPSIIQGLFTTQVPYLQTNDSEVILGFNFAGPRKIILQNDFNGENNVSTIEVFENMQWEEYSSPQNFWWTINSTHEVRAKSNTIPYSNLNWKFYFWNQSLNEKNLQKTVIANQDKSETAFFKTVFPLTVQTLLTEGGSGGEILYEGEAKNSPYNDYGFQTPFSTNIGVNDPQLINGRNYYLTSWQDGNTLSNRNISLTDTSTFTANLKGTQLSNDQDAYVNNSQRKFLHTSPYPYTTTRLHSVYESMGKVWYETSTDNGATWTIMNHGKPLSDCTSKCPSISPCFGYDGMVLITFQDYYLDDFFYRIRVLRYNPEYDILTEDLTPEGLDFAGNNTANPVIQANQNTIKTHILLIWEVKNDVNPFGGLPDGLYYLVGKDNATYTGYEFTGAPQIIDSTDANSYTPCLTQKLDHYEYPTIFHLAWEQRTSVSTSVLRYYKIQANDDYTISFPYYNGNISYGSGYQKNYAPSLIALDNSIVKAVWQGARYVRNKLDKTTSPQKTNIAYYWEYKTVYKDLTTGIQKIYGTKTNLPTINKLNDNSEFYLAYSEQSDLAGKVIFGSSLSGICDLEAYGKDVQIGNGNYESNVKANLFKSTSSPYYFNLSASMNHVTPKKNNLAILSGREGVVFKDTAQFYFAIGDVIVDNQPVVFKLLPDTLQINTQEMVNSFLETEPFMLSDNSAFYYSVQYGITDSSAAAQLLNENSSINFKIELIDAVTALTIGSFDDVTYSGDYIFQYDNIAYQVNTAGIGNTQVKLRLVINTAGEFDYSLSERFAEESVLGKSTIKQINLDGCGIVKEYALAQNFPNPFNPNTIIRYQIPKAGLVTIKVYDILGREVTTLVNEQKTAGRYEVNFNAPSLASGVYIYKLQAGDFVSSKKMILIK